MLVLIKRIGVNILGLTKFCYNSMSHSMTKMSLLERALGKEARKLINLAIPMRHTNHSKEAVKMVKGCGEKYTQMKKLLE